MSAILGECRTKSGHLLPAYERVVKWTMKAGREGVGRVKYHWVALDAAAVAIENGDGSVTNIIPEFGDTWRYWP